MKGSIIVIDLTIQTIVTYQTICDLSQTIVTYLTMLTIVTYLTIYINIFKIWLYHGITIKTSFLDNASEVCLRF